MIGSMIQLDYIFLVVKVEAEQSKFRLGNDELVNAKGRGTIIVNTKDDTKLITNVLIVCTLEYNLFYVRQMIQNNHSPSLMKSHR